MPSARIARIDIDPAEIATAARKVDIGIVGDCRSVLNQLLSAMKGKVDPDRYKDWRKQLADGVEAKLKAPGANKPVEDGDIHPLRLCEEIASFMQRDAILVVDGQEDPELRPPVDADLRAGAPPQLRAVRHHGGGPAVRAGRQAREARRQVICLHGDGSFGLNAMELDTAVRHKLPVLVVISLNGGWTADPNRDKPGRDLGYTRYDKMAEALGCLWRVCREGRGHPPGPRAGAEAGRRRQGRRGQRAHRLSRARRYAAVRAIFDVAGGDFDRRP